MTKYSKKISDLLEKLKSGNYTEDEIDDILKLGIEITDNADDVTEDFSQLCYHLGVVEASLENYKVANNYMEKSLELNREIFGDKHPYTAAAYANLADVLVSMEEYFGAIQQYQSAIECSEKSVGTMAPYTIMLYRKIAALYRVIDRNGKAIIYLTKALVNLETQDEQNDTTKSMIADVYLNLGEIHQAMNSGRESAEKGKEFLTKSKKLFSELLGENHDICSYIQSGIDLCDEQIANAPEEEEIEIPEDEDDEI